MLTCDYELLLNTSFSDLSLYQDCYKSAKNCILALKNLNELTGWLFEEGPLDYKSFINVQLNNFASEVINIYFLLLIYFI